MGRSFRKEKDLTNISLETFFKKTPPVGIAVWGVVCVTLENGVMQREKELLIFLSFTNHYHVCFFSFGFFRFRKEIVHDVFRGKGVSVFSFYYISGLVSLSVFFQRLPLGLGYRRKNLSFPLPCLLFTNQF